MMIIIQSSPRYPLTSSPTLRFGKHCMKSLVIKTAWQKGGKPLEKKPPKLHKQKRKTIGNYPGLCCYLAGLELELWSQTNSFTEQLFEGLLSLRDFFGPGAKMGAQDMHNACLYVSNILMIRDPKPKYQIRKCKWQKLL